MCGIAGFVFAAPGRTADLGVVERMTGTLVHRGPDGAGYLADGPAALGMRRLAIIDVAGGDQPVYSEDRDVAVVQNGEIYNYLELRQELEALGHKFRTQSDTEVLVHGYEAWGDELVEHLNGMWAFAIWDAHRQRLLLSRDRLGIKPLHYTWDGERLCFASEIKALLAAGVTARVRWEVLDAYVAFGYVPEPYSMYEGVHKLPGGHNLTLERGRSPVLRRYWQVPIVDDKDAVRDGRRVVEEFRTLFQDAVKLQLRSDVPLGAFLSGGLDSGSVVAVMSALVPAPVRTFTIGFAERGYDERPLAKLVADHFGTLHFERAVQPLGLEEAIAVLVHAFDEPFGDSSALATAAVSAHAREQVTVVLTGDGGDEVLAGYTRYQGEKFSQTYGTLPRFVRAGVVPQMLRLAANLVSGANRDRLHRVERVVEAANLDFVDRATRKQSWSRAALRQRLLRRRAGVRPAREFVDEALRECPARDNFQRSNWLDFKMVLPSQMLTKVDRMSMARSLEARVPFLDHRLVELMAPVSAQVKMPGYTRKQVLRQAFGPRLPKPVLQAPKHGFNVPMREWFRGGAAAALLERRLQAGFLDDIVEPLELRRLLQRHSAHREDHGVLFWILLQLSFWFERLG